MKWVKIRDGLQRLVDDSDERPAIKSSKKSLGIPFVAYSPSWRTYEADMHSDDKNVSLDASEKFEKEREHQMNTDPRAVRWEKSRKESWQKDKPYYVKKVEEVGI